MSTIESFANIYKLGEAFKKDDKKNWRQLQSRASGAAVLITALAVSVGTILHRSTNATEQNFNTSANPQSTAEDGPTSDHLKIIEIFDHNQIELKFQSILSYMDRSKNDLLRQAAQDYRKWFNDGTMYIGDAQNPKSTNIYSLDLQYWGGWPSVESSGYRISFLPPVRVASDIPQLQAGKPELEEPDYRLAVLFLYHSKLFKTVSAEYPHGLTDLTVSDARRISLEAQRFVENYLPNNLVVDFENNRAFPTLVAPSAH